MMKKIMNRRIICLIFFVLIIIAVNACSQGTRRQEYITIGALLPLTGEDSDEGLRAYNGLMIAREEINESGGILGKMIDIIVLNDRGDEDYIVQQYNKLKERGVAAIIGSSYSGVTMALAKAAEKDDMPIISPTASNPDVTQGRPNVFRAIFIDDYQAEVMAHFAYNSLSARTAVILKNISYSSYMHTADIFSSAFTNLGGQITAAEVFSNENDFEAILKRYASNPPDVFYCPENFIPAAALINTAHNLGISDTYFLGSDAWDGILTYVVNNDVMKNAFYSAPFSFDDKSEEVTKFVRNYFQIFSQMPITGSATAYTCVYILTDAIKRAEEKNQSIVSAIKETNLNTITGHIKYDENNNPHTNVYIITIKDGIYSTYQKLSL